MKRVLPFLAAVLAAALFLSRGDRGDPGALADRFYRRVFRNETAREVFGLEEEDVTAVFGAEEDKAVRV